MGGFDCKNHLYDHELGADRRGKGSIKEQAADFYFVMVPCFIKFYRFYPSIFGAVLKPYLMPFIVAKNIKAFLI